MADGQQWWRRPWVLGLTILLVLVAVGVPLLLVDGCGPTPSVAAISSDESWAHVGQMATVTYLVQSTTLNGESELLNALAEDVSQDGFSAVLAPSVVRQATFDPANYDFGHTIAVRGTVRLEGDRPTILVTTLDQITLASSP
jgi:hypothetical protein